MSEWKPDRWAVSLSVATGLLLGSCLFLAAKITNPPRLEGMDVEFWDWLGGEMPAFALETLAGEPLSEKTWREKDHVWVFGESGCGACDELYPTLEEISARMPVGLIATGKRAELATKVAEQGFSFPVAFDSLARVARSLDVRGYPTVMWVDGRGKVVKAASGVGYAERVMRLAAAAVDAQE